MNPQTLSQNTHNSIESAAIVDSEYCEDGSERVRLLLAELTGAGVVLSVDAGRLAFDSPAGAMTEERLARVRADREGLLALLQGKQPTIPEPSGAICPYCRGESLEDVERGWRCCKCKRLAWIWLPGGSIVRADCEHMDLEWN